MVTVVGVVSIPYKPDMTTKGLGVDSASSLLTTMWLWRGDYDHYGYDVVDAEDVHSNTPLYEPLTGRIP